MYHSTRNIEEAVQYLKTFKVEHALIFNKNGVCLRETIGDEENVPMFIEGIKENELIIIHNHPTGTLFSEDDVQYAHEHRQQIKELRVVCGDKIYVVDPLVCTHDKYMFILDQARVHFAFKYDEWLNERIVKDHKDEFWDYILTHCEGIKKL